MAYDRKKVYEQAVKAIADNNLFFIEDIVAFIPISKPTFYEFFPLDSNEFNTLKGLLNTNKIKTKSSIRSKLYKSDKAAELLSLYKLICSDDERRALSMQAHEHRITLADSNAILARRFPDKTEFIEAANEDATEI